jgi:hypothetical protein
VDVGGAAHLDDPPDVTVGVDWLVDGVIDEVPVLPDEIDEELPTLEDDPPSVFEVPVVEPEPDDVLAALPVAPDPG